MNDVQEWNPEVLENRIFMFMPFSYDADSTLDSAACEALNRFIEGSMKQMAPADFLEKQHRHFAKPPKTAAGQALWKDLTGDATKDFHLFIRQIASIKKTSEENAARFAHPLRLAEESLLSQRLGGKPRIFRLAFGKAAQRRCGKPEVFFQFHAPSLYAFSSGIAILVLELEYVGYEGRAVTANDVLEGNYEICHPVYDEAPTSQPANTDEIVTLSAKDFVELANELLPSNLSGKILNRRPFMYSALRIAKTPGEEGRASAALLAHRLSHRQTSDYRPDRSRVEKAQMIPFENVRHAAATEGGCTLVEGGNDAPEALRHLIRDRIRNTYMPLLLVNLHAYFWLIEQTQVLPGSSITTQGDDEERVLDDLYQRLLNYRRIFHFSIASQITQQNEYHQLWQEALLVEKQLLALSELSNSLAVKVSEARASEHERKLKWFGVASSCFGGFLLGKELIEVIRDKAVTNMYEWQLMLFEAGKTHDPAQLSAIHEVVHGAELWEWIVIGTAFLGAILGGAAALRFGIKSGHE